jgi:hypothetical protein
MQSNTARRKNNVMADLAAPHLYKKRKAAPATFPPILSSFNVKGRGRGRPRHTFIPPI